ncbi:L,D-transpeptidase family protein [Anaerovibrio sp. RM50]|uniref:L,D-transpeptidase family protein n=1 Tax=Anaerovibrio sp. RM50 TaxID=1200557 RepID=UPI0006850B25|nr:L,D-transpeptidase family protein [Anaerovibrio sp. RM50]
MKLFLLTILCLLIINRCPHSAQAAAAEANPFWQERLDHYSEISCVKQVIFVQYKGGSKALVKLYEKDDAQKWNLVLACDGYTGKNGLGKKSEGDKKTPKGDFGIFTAGGIEPNPGTKADYLLFDEHIFCADGPYYNKLIDDRKIPKEVLAKLDLDPMNNGAPQFNYGLFLTYNRECVPGLGSYIFIHCMGEYDYTMGCIAVSEENMIKILQHVDNNVRVCIYPA